MDETEYYKRRRDAEQALARSSERQEVREIHEELARQYEALLGQRKLRPILRIAIPRIF